LTNLFGVHANLFGVHDLVSQEIVRSVQIESVSWGNDYVLRIARRLGLVHSTLPKAIDNYFLGVLVALFFVPIFYHLGITTMSDVMMNMNKPTDGKNGYVAGYKGKKVGIFADTSFGAKKLALKHFVPPKSQQQLVWVEIASVGNELVILSTASL